VEDRIMATIKVARRDNEIFDVTVKDLVTTTHSVTLVPDYYDKLTGGKVPAETLIEKSFEFLLERESNTMILSEFVLPVIGEYFPEYESDIVKRF
jgi:hypothetical protein